MPRIVAIVFALVVLALVAAPASAETPLRMPGQLIDHVDALDAGGRADAQAAIDKLYTDHRIRLWVVYTADFSGQEPQAWADRTVQLSSLGNDDVLLAVATVDRSYYLSASSALPNVTDAEVDDVRTNAIEPALHQSDWAAAAIAAAGGIADATSSSGGVGVQTLLIGGGVVVVGAGGAVLYARQRRRGKTEAGAKSARDIDPSDTDALAALPVPVLDARSRDVLVEIDNAVRTSAEELELARGEFGDEAVRTFAAAFDNAKAALTQAFSIRQRLDDDVPETEAQQRDLLVQLISSCGRADRELDGRVEEFDAMRNLLIDADQRLDALTQQTVDLTVRIPNSEATLAKLSTEFPASVLAPVSSNATMAKERLAFADSNVTAARQTVALPAGQQGPAVAAIRAAEGAVAQARSLLDAVDNAAANIRTAVADLPAVLDDARKDVATANELAPHGDQALARAKAAAEEALADADPTSNPLGSYNAVVSADAELDKAIAAATDRKQEADRLRRQLDQALTAARAQVSAASDFIETRRGAVNADARTRLSEAGRQLDEAQRLQSTDVAQALQHAAAAADLGARALASAQSDVRAWENNQSSSHSGGNAGAVLGGIILDGVLRGGFGGGSHGGRYGSGGYRSSPGSFGGAGSSRRIGGGGRF